MALTSLFNQTVIGAKHVSNGTSCEDASLSWIDESREISFIAVSDGHGDPNCFRSKIGSTIAVETTSEMFLKFADSLDDICDIDEYFRDPSVGKQHIKRLTDSIVDAWLTRVTNHYSDNIVVDEETKYITKSLDILETDIPSIYGATLIAVLKYRNYLIGIHQGDGRCIAVKENGDCYEPIPWDDLCEANRTTSLCNDGAASRIRNCIIDVSSTPIAGIFLLTDGIEDSYNDSFEEIGGSHYLMAGTHIFVKTLCINLCKVPDYLSSLESYLTEFSRIGQFQTLTGSRDDISVAGIYDESLLKKLITKFEIDAEIYEIDEEIFYYNNKLNKKRRNHEFLESKVNSLRSECSKTQMELNRIRKEIEAADETICELQRRVYEVNEKTAALGNSRVSFESRIDEFISMLTDWVRMKDAFLNVYDDEKRKLNNEANRILEAIEKERKARDLLKDSLVFLTDKKHGLESELETFEQRYEEEHSTFQEIQDYLGSLEDKKNYLERSLLVNVETEENLSESKPSVEESLNEDSAGQYPNSEENISEELQQDSSDAENSAELSERDSSMI